MAHVWIPHHEAGWAVVELTDDQRYALEAEIPRRLGSCVASDPEATGVTLQPVTADGQDRWLLIASPDTPVMVNGTPLGLGLAVLADRDEIRMPGAGRFYFTTERPVQVELFPAPPAGSVPTCPRCRLPMEQLAVRCPECGVWYHQRDESECWTYAATCALCPAETTLDGGFRWTPDEV